MSESAATPNHRCSVCGYEMYVGPLKVTPGVDATLLAFCPVDGYELRRMDALGELEAEMDDEPKTFEQFVTEEPNVLGVIHAEAGPGEASSIRQPDYPIQPSAATVWLVTANCPDYYCEGVHVVAVARTAGEAETLKAEAEEATWTNSAGSSGKRWCDLEVEEVLIGELREEARSFVYPA